MGDPRRSESESDPSTEESSLPSDTRRGVLATVGIAAMGLGTLGAFRGQTAKDRNPPHQERIEQRSTSTAEQSPTTESPSSTPMVGANLNGRPHRLLNKMSLLEASNTTYVRAFIDVRQKLEADRQPKDDPDIVALRRAAQARNCRLVVSLKWDFTAHWGDKEPMRVPSAGSDSERALCRCATRYLAAIGAAVDVVVLGNEPMWETQAADIQIDDPPVVRFTRTVKDYLIRHGDHGDPIYLVGALNRAHNEDIRKRRFPEFFQATFDFVRSDTDVDGVDLHLHYDALSDGRAMIDTTREALPHATITATEFSPIFRYARNVNEPIDVSEPGEQFLHAHDLPSGITGIEYFERAKQHPRSPDELADFYAAMPWFNENHLADIHAVLTDYDVEFGTFGFLQDIGMRNVNWADGWLPFHINFLYQPALTTTADGIEGTANRHYLDDYRYLAGGGP